MTTDAAPRTTEIQKTTFRINPIPISSLIFATPPGATAPPPGAHTRRTGCRCPIWMSRDGEEIFRGRSCGAAVPGCAAEVCTDLPAEWIGRGGWIVAAGRKTRRNAGRSRLLRWIPIISESIRYNNLSWPEDRAVGRRVFATGG